MDDSPRRGQKPLPLRRDRRVPGLRRASGQAVFPAITEANALRVSGWNASISGRAVTSDMCSFQRGQAASKSAAVTAAPEFGLRRYRCWTLALAYILFDLMHGFSQLLGMLAIASIHPGDSVENRPRAHVGQFIEGGNPPELRERAVGGSCLPRAFRSLVAACQAVLRRAL